MNKILANLEENAEKYYFRGFKESREMISTLGRQPSYVKNEFNMLTDICNSSEIREFTNINCLQYLLEYSQHYELPTRLLDWSKDPLVALYFSVFEKNGTYSNNQVNIAMLSIDNDLNDSSDIYYPLVDDFDGELLTNLECLYLSEMSSVGWKSKIHDLECFLKVANRIYRKLINNSESVSLLTYEEDKQNENKYKQKGLFSLHKNPTEPFPDNKYSILKINLSVNQKLELLSVLDKKGINQNTLFSNSIKYTRLKNRCITIKNHYS
jgi:hypothetical protein